MSNLYALDETLDMLNGTDKDYQNYFTNIYDVITKESSYFYNFMNESDLIITEGKTFDKIKTIIKKWVEKAKNVIEKIIVAIKLAIKDIKALGSKSYIFRNATIKAYAKSKHVPLEVLTFEKMYDIIPEDVEIDFLDNMDEIIDDIDILSNSNDLFHRYYKNLDLINGDLNSKDIFNSNSGKNTIDECLETIESSFNKIDPDKIKSSKVMKGTINKNDYYNFAKMCNNINNVYDNALHISVEFKYIIKKLEKISQAIPDNEDLFRKNARMMLDYSNRGFVLYNKMYNNLGKINKITMNTIVSITKTAIDCYSKYNKNEEK